MEIVQILAQINRWWFSGKVDKNFVYPALRSEFKKIIDSIDQEGILSIIGPRRSGKSVLLLNVIDHLLKQGIQKERILFFSGDDPALFNGKINLGDIFEKYANDVLHENLNDLSKKIFILILLKSQCRQQ